MNSSIVITLIIAACLTLTACEKPEQEQLTGVRAYDLYLLIGQSNMAGRGVVAHVDRTGNPNIKTLNREGEWVPAVDPIHFDKPIAGVGPGRSFAMAVLKQNPSKTIGLIPGAVGGSPISSWEPGGYHEPTDTHPYDDALERARIALRSGEIKAILWHQGESDSNETLAPLYKENLIQLIERLRTDLDNPDLPVLIGQLGQFEEKPWNEWRMMIDKAHREAVQELNDVFFVPSDGLSHKGDTLHFSAEASREFGERYADVYRDATR
ncbi:MAG: sialate O-acetylesterase [Rhodothermaceae bacterium]|nr:sialate O-acetylesterase [Rhodothermaceae bacterium]